MPSFCPAAARFLCSCKRWMSLLVATVLLSTAMPGWSAAVVPWLYEVSVPVDGQGSAERRRASSDALLIMLRRATGLAHVPRSPEVVAALEEPESFYNEFSFANAEDGALMLVVQFDARAVLALQKRAGLPIWRSARERVVAWMVLEQGGERRLLGATGADVLAAAVAAAARDRGIDVTLPLLDLEDQLSVTPAAVWGRLSGVLEDASVRYGADVLMVGRLRAGPDGSWMSDWEFWLDDGVVLFDAAGADPLAQAQDAVARLADELAARSAVYGRESGRLELSVSGIRTPADYARLLRYLEGLEFVDALAVRELTAERLRLALATRADAEQLLTLFEADRQLFNDRLTVYDGADLRLVLSQQ